MNLLLTGCFKYLNEQIKALSLLGYTVYFMQNEDSELPIPASMVDVTVCNGLFLHHNIESFKNLKMIQLTSTGLDRVPLSYIEEKNIKLHNARGVYSIPMAEWVIFRVLERFKKGWFFKKNQENSSWIKDRDLRELNGCMTAILGAGNVGQEVARLFKAFGAFTCGFDIHVNKTSNFDRMFLIKDLKEKIMDFDIVVVTVPLLPSTFHLISEDVLWNMKVNAMLINIARGSLVDESVLYHVLSNRRDLFAVLDVFETEPLSSDNPLWKLDNIAISPHNSFVSNGNNARMFGVIYKNLSSFIKGE